MADHEVVVPFAAATEDRLLTLLSEEPSSGRAEEIAALLREDSAFARWASVAVAAMEVTPCAELAAWLGANLESALASIEPAACPNAGRLAQLAKRLCKLAELESRFSKKLQREKLKSLAEFAYGASHEINNPLANIAARAQTLLDDEPDPERKRTLAAINGQAFRAHEMVADMMLVARPPTLNHADINIGQLLAELADQFRPIAAQQESQLRFAVPADQLSVSADPVQLQVAVAALIRNALEALAHGGVVELACSEAVGSGVAISVADNGPGIANDVLPHIFDPFFSGREAGRGLGFGLSKCWRIVTLHGGQVTVDSRAGVGTTFEIVLPAKSPAAAPD